MKRHVLFFYKIILSILAFFSFYLHNDFLHAQSVKAGFPLSHIRQTAPGQPGTYTASLGASVDQLAGGIHGITYKLSFDPSVIYPDSVFVSANSKLLGLNRDEYLEMQRTDKNHVLYSITMKGREKTLDLKNLPLVIDFAIKPDTYYQLLANNCKYTIEFQAESVTAYDLEQTTLKLSPFVLPIEIECEDSGETEVLVAAPNPTKERCWVRIPPEKTEFIRRIVLFDAKGEQLQLHPKQSDDVLELNLSHLRPGHYYVNILYHQGKKDVVKIVKV